MKTTLIVLATCLLVAYSMEEDVFCTSPLDCQFDECCVIGMQRYSTPVCRRLRQQNEWCRPYAEPSNRTLHYPNGQMLVVADVYTLMCPCDQGLSCEQGFCQSAHEFNALD